MTVTARIARCDINDPDATTPTAPTTVTYELDDDSPTALTPRLMVALQCEIPRANVPALQAALAASGIVVLNAQNWPTQAIALPLPKKT
jgi:hypothetical protein